MAVSLPGSGHPRVSDPACSVDTMNAGQQVLDFLYSTQLQVDDEWAVRTPNGFTWWAAGNAQAVEIIGEAPIFDGMNGYLVCVRTEMVSGLDLTDAVLADLNAGLMRIASMSGPVYNPATKTLSLASLVRVHDANASWMGMLLSTAAVLQLAEAHAFGEKLAEDHGAHLAISGHPDRGVRQEPDEMIHAAAQLFGSANRRPLQLQESDFEDAVTRNMMQPPSLGASAGGLGLTVEFPFGNASSLCQFSGEAEHPLYGDGLLIVQRFPHGAPSEADGVRLALEFNRDDLTYSPSGDGFGSYLYVDDMVCFSGFLPNLLLREGVLSYLYHSCAARAFSMSVGLLGDGWDGEFNPENALEKMMRDDG